MKVNPETTKADRLRIVIGALLAVSGAFTLVVIGAFYSYTNSAVWVAGLLLLAGGLFIAGSARLAMFLQDITRM